MGELGVPRVECGHRLHSLRAPLPVGDVEAHGDGEVARLVGAHRQGARRHHRQRGRDPPEHRRAIDHERPPSREGPEPLHVVDLADAQRRPPARRRGGAHRRLTAPHEHVQRGVQPSLDVDIAHRQVHLAECGPARGVDEAPQHHAEGVLEGGRELPRSVVETVDLAEPEAGLVRRRAAPGPEVSVLAAGVQRVAAEADREDLQRQVVGVVPLLGAPSLLHEVEELGRGARDGLPRLLEVGLLHGDAARARGQQRGPEAERERARAALDRVDGCRALSEPPLRIERERVGVLERDGERGGEALRACVGLLVVVLGGHPREVLDAQLEVQRIALGALDRVGHADDLEPAAGVVERPGLRPARHLSQGVEGCLHVGVTAAAAPHRRETLRERTRRHGAAVAREDAPREPVPHLARSEQVGRRRGDGGEHPGVLAVLDDVVEEGGRERRQASRRHRRDGRGGPLLEDR